MSTISGLGITDYSYLFSNSSTTNTGSTASASTFLADYASIKNGSYGKLMRAYYTKGSGAETKKADTTKETKNNTQVKSDTASLKEAADALVTTGSKSVFNLTDVKDKDGNTKKGYDYDAIYDAVKNFADEYNSMIDSASESDANGILRRTLNMTNETKANYRLLGQVGITIGADNKLTVDEKTLKEANIHDLKTLFNGAGSYAYNVSSKASVIGNLANSELQKMSNYSAKGDYSYANTVGKLYDGTI